MEVHLIVSNIVNILCMLVFYGFHSCLSLTSSMCWERDKSIEFEWPWLDLQPTWISLLINVLSSIRRNCPHNSHMNSAVSVKQILQIFFSKQCIEYFFNSLLLSDQSLLYIFLHGLDNRIILSNFLTFPFYLKKKKHTK